MWRGLVVVMVMLSASTSACDSGPAVGDSARALRATDGVGENHQQLPIVNGVTDLVDPAVVALTDRGQQFCTGTLVAPQLVVTAAHCLPREGESLADLEVFVGDDTNGDGLWLPILEANPHPSWPTLGAGYDIGTVVVPPVAVTPISLPPFRLDADRVGDGVTVVGFGVSEAGSEDHFVKRMGRSSIEEITPLLLKLTADYYSDSYAITCNGDSGGPALLTWEGGEYLVGVHITSDCQRRAADVRIDAHLHSFVEPFLSADGECAQTARSREIDDDDNSGNSGADQPLDPDCGDICAALGGCHPDCDFGECPGDGEQAATGCAIQHRGGRPGEAFLVFVMAMLLAVRRRRA